MKDIQVTDQQLVVLAQEMLKQAQDDESLLKDVYELLKQRFNEETVPHWTDGEIAIDGKGRLYSSDSTGAIYIYVGARTLEEAQHAQTLEFAINEIRNKGSKVVRNQNIPLPEDDPELVKAKRKYTEYRDHLEARTSKDFPGRSTTATPA